MSSIEVEQRRYQRERVGALEVVDMPFGLGKVFADDEESAVHNDVTVDIHQFLHIVNDTQRTEELV